VPGSLAYGVAGGCDLDYSDDDSNPATHTFQESDQLPMDANSPISTEDLERLKDLAGDLPAGAVLRLNLTGHPASSRFEAYGRQLREALPAIDLLTDISSETDPPWLETAAGIRFEALPDGRKLDSLVAALKPTAPGESPLPDAHAHLLARMALPVELRLFIAPGCPHCPQALEQWVALTRAGEKLRLRAIDGALFPEAVQADKIQAVPTLILDEHLRWSGRIPVADVLEQAAGRDPSRLSAKALEGIIKEGQAGPLARAMIDSGTLFPALFDLLTHDKWPVRLGAMVVMEEIAAADGRLAAEALPVLCRRYETLDDAVRGDVLYIIGATGDGQIVPFLETVVGASTDPEVKQAAAEAIGTIRERTAAG
jgi:hypothetical protein